MRWPEYGLVESPKGTILTSNEFHNLEDDVLALATFGDTVPDRNHLPQGSRQAEKLLILW